MLILYLYILLLTENQHLCTFSVRSIISEFNLSFSLSFLYIQILIKFVSLYPNNERFACLWHLVSNVYFNFLGMLVRALESDWAVLSEEIGLWIPIEVANEEHNDKPESTTEIGNNFSCQNVSPHLL